MKETPKYIEFVSLAHHSLPATTSISSNLTHTLGDKYAVTMAARLPDVIITAPEAVEITFKQPVARPYEVGGSRWDGQLIIDSVVDSMGLSPHAIKTWASVSDDEFYWDDNDQLVFGDHS